MTAWVLFVGLLAGDASLKPFSFVDDRGERIEIALEACLVETTGTRCLDAGAWARQWIEGQGTESDLFSVRLEGPEHGPVTIEPESIETSGAERRIVVPRKARLTVENSPADGVTLSLYAADGAFVRPDLRVPLSGEAAEVWIPAGDFVASLSRSGKAPDLHRLDAPPGSEPTLRYEARAGWSLVLRAAASDGSVRGARIVLRDGFGYGARPPRDFESDAAGLVLANGSEVPILAVEARHPDFLDASAPAISATPGTFAFYEISLRRGGSLDARVTCDGETAGGVAWKMATSESERDGASTLRTLFAGKTDEEGRVRLDGLPAGPYLLRLLPEKRPEATREIWIEEEITAKVEVALVEIRVDGTVYAGEEGAPSYEVVAVPVDFRRGTGAAEPVARATTDEGGEYLLALGVAGDYLVAVRNPDGVVGDLRPERIEADTTIDFHLSSRELVGRVIDEAGIPLEGASIVLAWRGRTRVARSGVNGRFRFPLDDGGAVRGPSVAEMKARLEGYRSPETRRVEVPEGGAPPEVDLVLTRRDRRSGHLRRVDGSSVAAGWVILYDLSAGESLPRLVETLETDEKGRFDLARTPATVRLFYGGPACPLGFADLSPSSAEASTEPIRLECAPAPTNLVLTLRDQLEAPLAGEPVLLRRGTVVIPRGVVAHHLRFHGLPAETSAEGRLVLAALAPGSYELYLASATSPMNVVAGIDRGRIDAIDLAPRATVEWEVVVREADR